MKYTKQECQIGFLPTNVIVVNPGNPVPKPRQTRSDKWKKRKCVVRYREWADGLRGQASIVQIPLEPTRVRVIAYFALPKSWSIKKKDKMTGKPHKQTPDADNVLKAVCDALWEKDQVIYKCQIEKYWDDGDGPRTEVYIENLKETV